MSETTDIAHILAVGPTRSPVAADGGLWFLYEGPAQGVSLNVMEDRFPTVPPLEAKGGAWAGFVPFPARGAMEYKLTVTRPGKSTTILDPLNPSRARDPFGSNSVALGPDYRPPWWLESDPPRGEIRDLSFKSQVWTGVRRHQIYLPPGYDRAAGYPLIILHDGPEYVEFARLDRCLDALIAGGHIPACIVFLHQPRARLVEYVDDPRHHVHVIDEILPRVRRKFRLTEVIAAGTSLGAVASLSLAFRRAGSIDSLLLQSGSFVRELGGPFGRGEVLEPVTRLIPEVLTNPEALPQRITMSCGTFDGLVEDHRNLVPLLKSHRPSLAYAESDAGHHWLCWRDRLEGDLVSALRGAAAT